MRPLYLVSYSLAFAKSSLRSHGVLRLQLQLVGQPAQLRLWSSASYCCRGLRSINYGQFAAPTGVSILWANKAQPFRRKSMRYRPIKTAISARIDGRGRHARSASLGPTPTALDWLIGFTSFLAVCLATVKSNMSHRAVRA